MKDKRRTRSFNADWLLFVVASFNKSFIRHNFESATSRVEYTDSSSWGVFFPPGFLAAQASQDKSLNKIVSEVPWSILAIRRWDSISLARLVTGLSSFIRASIWKLVDREFITSLAQVVGSDWQVRHATGATIHKFHVLNQQNAAETKVTTHLDIPFPKPLLVHSRTRPPSSPERERKSK